MAKNDCVSKRLESIRNELISLRRQLEGTVTHFPVSTDRLTSIIGLFTCGISELYHLMGAFQQMEIQYFDRMFGPSYHFVNRGIGTESGLKCFVCGSEGEVDQHYLANISAFVDSKQSGEQIVHECFNGLAYLDYREHEPEHIQVKVGACRKHISCLDELDKIVSDYNVIRKMDVDKCKAGNSDSTRATWVLPVPGFQQLSKDDAITVKVLKGRGGLEKDQGIFKMDYSLGLLPTEVKVETKE